MRATIKVDISGEHWPQIVGARGPEALAPADPWPVGMIPVPATTRVWLGETISAIGRTA